MGSATEGAPNLPRSGFETRKFVIKEKLCAPGSARMFSFKKQFVQIEKGCRLPFGSLTGSIVERPMSKPMLSSRSRPYRPNVD